MKDIGDLTLKEIPEICENNICKFCPLYDKASGFCGINDRFPKDWDFTGWRGDTI